MESKNINLRFDIIALMIVLAAFSRIVPHMYNFSPLGAIGLFGAAYFTKKWHAFVIPLAATWLSDLFINNVIYAQYYPKFTWLAEGFYWQYGAYVLIVIAGLFILKTVNLKTMLGGALASTIIFFLVSNFGCWPGSSYPQNAGGLLLCYEAGLPFIGGTLIGDLFYSAVLFGSFALIQKQVPAVRLAKVHA